MQPRGVVFSRELPCGPCDLVNHINHPKRSTFPLTTEDHRRLQRATPARNELLAPMNDFMRRQFANQDPSRTNMLISVFCSQANWSM